MGEGFVHMYMGECKTISNEQKSFSVYLFFFSLDAFMSHRVYVCVCFPFGGKNSIYLFTVQW